MILAEDEVDLGTDHSRDHAARRRATSRARRSPTSCRSSTPCSRSRRATTGPTSRPSTASPARSRRCSTCRSRPCPGARPRDLSRATSRWTSASTTSSAARATSGGCSATCASATSPRWLKARLLGAGMRPISNVVDVTNYVMLALGNPLHAFDHAKLAEGRIVVRRAREGETIRTLDGTERDADDRGARDRRRRAAGRGRRDHGRRGDRGLGRDARHVLLEAANFEQLGVLRSGERLHMRSEAQTRWEKGVAPELAEPAANHATELLLELTGARWTGHADVQGGASRSGRVIRLRPTRAEEVVGIPIAEDEQRERLDAARLRRRRALERRRAVLARARRAARDRPRRGGRALPPRARCRRRCPYGASCSAGSRASSDCGASSPTCSSAAASSRRTRTRSRPDDPHPDALVLPEPLVGAAARPPHDAAPRARRSRPPQRQRRQRGRRAVRDRARLPADRRARCRTSRGAWAGSSTAASTARRARSSRSSPRSSSSRASSARRIRSCRRRHPRRVEGGWVAQLDPRLLDGEWAAFELDLAELFAHVPERVLYEDVITYPPVRQDLAFSVPEEVVRGRARRGRARRPPAPSCARCARSTSTAASRSAPGRKSIAFAVDVPVAGAHALRRGRRAAARRDRRGLDSAFGAELRAGRNPISRTAAYSVSDDALRGPLVVCARRRRRSRGPAGAPTRRRAPGERRSRLHHHAHATPPARR